MKKKFTREFFPTFISILQIKPCQINKSVIYNQEIKEILDIFEFPYITQSDIIKIHNDFEKFETLGDSMRSISFYFPFSPKIFDTFIKIDWSRAGNENSNISSNSLNDEKRLIIQYVLFSFISFCILFERACKIPNSEINSFFPLVIASLNNIISFEAYTKLSVYSIIYLLQIYSRTSNFSDFGLILDSIRHFFQFSKFLPEQSYFLFSYLIIGLLQNHKSNELNEILVFITVFIEERNVIFPENATKMLIQAISKEIEKLNLYSVDLFSHLAHFLPNECIKPVCDHFVFGIIKYQKQNPFLKIISRKNIDDSLIFKQFTSSTILEFASTLTFEDGFNEIKIELPEPKNIQELVDAHLSPLLSLLKKANEGNSQIIPIFLKTLINYPLGIDTAAVFIYSSIFFNQTLNDLFPLFNIIFKIDETVNLIISQSNSMCNKSSLKTLNENVDDFESNLLLNSLRESCFKMMLNLSPNSLVNLITYASSSPFLFAEIIYRCKNNFHEIEQIISTTKFLTSIFKGTTLLQHLSYKKELKEADSIRMLIFNLFFELFKNPQTLNYLVNDSLFLNSYLGFLFEKNIYPIFIHNLFCFISDQIDCLMLASSFANLFEILLVSFPKEDYINLANALITQIDDVCYKYKKLHFSFSLACPPLFQAIIKLNESNASKIFFINFINLVIHISDSLDFSKDFCDCFTQSIILVFGNHPPDDLYLKIVNFLANETEILHPNALFIIFNAFPRKVPEMIEKMKYFIHIKQSNAIVCQNSGFVDFLIENENYYDLFEIISQQCSTQSFVVKFLSLMKPQNNILPPKFEQMLNVLHQMALFEIHKSDSNKRFELVPNSTHEFRTYINHDFSFLFYFQSSQMSPQYYPVIFTLTSSSSYFCEIFVVLNKIHINFDPNHHEKSLSFPTPIPTDKLCFIGLTFTNVSIILYIDSQQCGSINYIHTRPDNSKANIELPFTTNCGKTTFVFGGTLVRSIKPSSPAKISSYAFYKQCLTEKQISAIGRDGEISLGRNTINPLFSYLVPYPELQNNNNFIAILVQEVQYEGLLPLFKYIDYQPIFENFFDILIDLLEIFLLFGCSVQKTEYVSVQTICILSSFLSKKLDQRHLNYFSFLRFFSIVNKLTNIQMKTEIMEKIIFNFSILIRCEKEDQKKIVETWPIIEICQPDIYHKVMKFSTILNRTALFFYDDENIRKKLFVLLPSKYTKDDYELVIAYVLKGDDFSVDLLSSFQKIITNSFQSDFIFSFHQLFQSSNAKIVQKSLEILVELHTLSPCHNQNKNENQILDEVNENSIDSELSLSEHLSVVFKMIRQNIIDKEFYEFSLSLLKTRSPDLFSFCSLCASMLDMSDSFFNEIKSPLDYTQKTWALAPLSLMNEKNYEIVLSFLSKAKSTQWKYIIATVEVMKIENSEKLKHDFLMKVEVGPSDLFYFHKIASNFIFFKKCSEKGKALNNLYINSPFYSQADVFNSNMNRNSNNMNIDEETVFIENDNKMNSIDDNLEKRTNETYKNQKQLFENFYRFGLRFDEKGEWLDSDLALKMIQCCKPQTIEKMMNHKFNNKFLIAAGYFLIRSAVYSKSIVFQCFEEPNFQIVQKITENIVCLNDLLGTLECESQLVTEIVEDHQTFERRLNKYFQTEDNAIDLEQILSSEKENMNNELSIDS